MCHWHLIFWSFTHDWGFISWACFEDTFDMAFHFSYNLFIYNLYLFSSKWKADKGAVYSLCLCSQHHLLSAGRRIKLWNTQTRQIIKVIIISLSLFYFKYMKIIWCKQPRWCLDPYKHVCGTTGPPRL